MPVGENIMNSPQLLASSPLKSQNVVLVSVSFIIVSVCPFPHSPQIADIAKGPGESTSASSKAGSLSQMLSPSRSRTRSRGLSMNILDSSLGSNTSSGSSPAKTSSIVERKTDLVNQSQVHPQPMSPPTQRYHSTQTSSIQTPRTPERDSNQNASLTQNNSHPIAFGCIESSSSSSHSEFDSDSDSDYDGSDRRRKGINVANSPHRIGTSEAENAFSQPLHTRNFLQQKKMFYSGQAMSSLSGFIPNGHAMGGGVEGSTLGSTGSISTSSTISSSSTVLPPLRTDRRSEELRAALLLSTSSLIKAHQPSQLNTSIGNHVSTNTNIDTHLSSSSSSHTSSSTSFLPHNTAIVSVPSTSTSTPSSSMPSHSTLSPMSQKNVAFASLATSPSLPFSTPLSTPFSSPIATSPAPTPVGLLASPRPTLFPEEYWSTSARRVISQLRILSASLGSAPGGDRGGSLSIRTLLQRESTIARTEANLVPLGPLLPSLLKEATAVERLFALSPLGSFGTPGVLESSPVLKFDEVLTLFTEAQKDQAKEREAYEQKEREKEERRTSRTSSYDGSRGGSIDRNNSSSDLSFTSRVSVQPTIRLSIKTIKTSSSGSSTEHINTTQNGLGSGPSKETAKASSTSMPDCLTHESSKPDAEGRAESDGEEDVPITQSGPLVF